jgi:hypothetical protein
MLREVASGMVREKLPRVERTLGRYRITGELGRGAMGAVYRAVDPMIEREVAIKTLLPDLPEEVVAEVRERFLREARSAGRLNHPNIVVIYDVGEHEGTAYMAMELLEGRSLQQILKGGERLPCATTADLCAQVADALDHAQRYSIVHRDVKPANIMVDGAGRAKLTDFGVAHLPTSEMTRTGATLGSPKYMSPEQVLGQTPDPRGDLFSLGVVLYEMLSGKHPFQRPNDTVFGLMHRIAGEPHVPLAEADAAVPSGFHRIIDRALAKDAAARYQRAAEMASDLRSWRALGTSETRTAPLHAVQPAAARPAPARAAPLTELLADIDRFAGNLESDADARAAEEARLRSERETKPREPAWEFPQILADPEPAATPAPADPANAKRRATLELLRKQAAAPAAPAESAHARGVKALDEAMRDAARYLQQIVEQINAVRPQTEKPCEFRFLGSIPSVALSDAAVAASEARIEGRSLCERVRLEYRAAPVRPHAVTLQGDEIGRCVRFLKMQRTEHKALAEKRNDFGVPTRAQITVTGALPCEVTLRADYEALDVRVELSAVRRIGVWRGELDAAALDAAVDDLVRYVLGADDDFEKRVSRAG